VVVRSAEGLWSTVDMTTERRGSSGNSEPVSSLSAPRLTSSDGGIDTEWD